MELSVYLFKSVAILSLFYGVYFLFLRKDTLFAAKRHYFLAGIVAALCFPFLEFTKTVYRELPAPSLLEGATIEPLVAQVNTAPDPVIAVDGWQIVMFIYAAGVFIMAMRFVFQLFSLLKLIRNYPSEKHKKFTFVKVDEAITPFSFFKYIVFNPASHSEEELKMILKHEKVHASQWHSIDIIIGHITRALQWINPFSWWYKKSLEENLEFIADNETVAQISSKKEYQLVLVKTSSTSQAPALTTQFYQSFIKKRIIMLNKSSTKKRNLWKLSLVLPALALFLWSFNVTEVITYKEAVPSDISKTPSYTISSETTNAELDAIETQLSKQAHPGLVRIDDRMRNEQDQLFKLSIKTKFDRQFDFHTNAVIGNDSDKGIGKWNFKFAEGAFQFKDLETQNLIKATAAGVTGEMPLPVESKKVMESGTSSSQRTINSAAAKLTGPLLTLQKPEKSTKEFRFTITKNTTNEQLEGIKEELKRVHGFDMKYKVDRNSNNEITSISISYSNNQGRNGNYSIQDDTPIDDFVFFLNEDGESGFWSEAQEARRAERMENRMMEKKKRMEERNKRLEEREQEIIELKERMVSGETQVEKEELEERLVEMKERRQEMKERRDEMEVRRNEMAKRSNTRARELKDRQKELRAREFEVINGDGTLKKLKGKNGTYVYSDGQDSENTVIITKDTSDKALADIKKEMDALGISFDYSKVKRNAAGEITRIKITTTNGKGSKSVVTAEADDGEPINEIIIQN